MAMPGVWVVDVCGNLYRNYRYRYHVHMLLTTFQFGCTWACNVSVNVSDAASERASAASGVAQTELGAGAPRQIEHIYTSG
jgi:hypothetical protein